MRDLAKDLEYCNASIKDYRLTVHVWDFVRQAMHGWPEAIKRATIAEKQRDMLEGCINMMDEEEKHLSAQVAALHKALISRIDSSENPDAALSELLRGISDLEGVRR